MKHIILFLMLLSGFFCHSPEWFNTYKPATLKLRNGEILKGEAKIIDGEDVKFRKKKKKELYTYRTLDRFTILKDGKKVTYS